MTKSYLRFAVIVFALVAPVLAIAQATNYCGDGGIEPPPPLRPSGMDRAACLSWCNNAGISGCNEWANSCNTNCEDTLVAPAVDAAISGGETDYETCINDCSGYECSVCEEYEQLGYSNAQTIQGVLDQTCAVDSSNAAGVCTTQNGSCGSSCPAS